MYAKSVFLVLRLPFFARVHRVAGKDSIEGVPYYGKFIIIIPVFSVEVPEFSGVNMSVSVSMLFLSRPSIELGLRT